MVTNISSSSVCQTKDSITTNVGTTAMNIDTSIKSETVIDLGNGFYLTNEGFCYCCDPLWSNIDSQISESLTTKEGVNMKENILNINVIVPGKVVEITFYDTLKEKMVCNKDDIFDLRKCCFIAIAKHLYKQEYTQEGIEYMATQLTYQKKYVKIVDTALKAYAKKEKDKEAAEKERIEREKITARQRERRRKQKERRIQRYREDMIDLLADSINEAKKRRKQSM